jgi:hypothetical protein
VAALEWLGSPRTEEEAIEISNIIERKADYPQSMTIFIVTQLWFESGPEPLLEELRKVVKALRRGQGRMIRTDFPALPASFDSTTLQSSLELFWRSRSLLTIPTGESSYKRGSSACTGVG